MQAMVAFQLSLLMGLILFIILVFCCIYHVRDLVNIDQLFLLGGPLFLVVVSECQKCHRSAEYQANSGQGRGEFGFDILDLSLSEYQQPLNFLPNQSLTS